LHELSAQKELIVKGMLKTIFQLELKLFYLLDDPMTTTVYHRILVGNCQEKSSISK